MREESDVTRRRVRRKRRGIPFRVQVGLVALVAVALGYGLGYYAISLLTMPQASAGETVVSTPAPALPASGEPPGGGEGQTSGRDAAEGAPAPEGSATTSPDAATSAAPATDGGLYRVQVGAFTERERAQALADQLRAQGFEASITSGPPYRVQAGAFRSESGAQARLQELREAGYSDAFIQRTSP